MFGDNPQDHQIRHDWHAFCDSLKSAGDLLFKDTTPADDITRATGLRLLARNIALGLQFELDNHDSRHPDLVHYFDPLRKQGGDNTDALYVGAPVNGYDNYRIRGSRGSARYFAVTLLEDGDTPWGGQVVASLFGPNLITDDEGNFDLYIGPNKPVHAGPCNWLQSTPDTYRVTFRQFFADWNTELPMQAQIECLSHQQVPAPLQPEKVGAALIKAAHWVQWSTSYWAEQLNKWQAHPNRFYAYGEWDQNRIDATPGGLPLIAYWEIHEHEAMIIRVTPPRADYWAVEFGNYWWESMDYRNRLCSTNCHHATLEDNGELILVLAHQDPGTANWLDCSGYPQGYVTFRWIGADDYPRPVCEKIPYTELEQQLPSNIKRFSCEQRQQQLALRKAGVKKRFPY